MNGNTTIIVIILAIIVVGGWFFFSGVPAKAPTINTETASPVVSTTKATTSAATPSVTVAYTDQGFSPNSVTVALGTTVTFVNQSTKDVWVASAKHPDHTVYGGTSLSQHCPDTANTAFDECGAGAPGSSYSFTFNKEGTWKYHNHITPTQFGAIVVTAVPAPTPI